MAPVGRQGSDLPAPYVSPWQRLWRDLQDLPAWTGLKLRELARRNAQSDLPRPSFWPEGLAPLFWPLVLLAAVVLAWTAVQVLSGGVAGRELPPAPLTAPSPGGTPPAGGVTEQDRPPVEESGAPAEPREPAVPPAQEGAPTARESGTDPSPPAAPEEAEDPDRRDPLLLDRFTGTAEAEGIVVEIATEAATGTLRLRLSPAFDALGQEIRERTAERWLNEAAALGYDNLELSGADGRPLGRNALVGSGMILLDSAAK